MCPATLVLARHADAAFAETWFSDEGGSLTTAGRAQATELGAGLRHQRVAAVYCSDTSRAVQTAEIAASRLQVGVTACKSLREVFIGALLGTEFDVTRIRQVSDRWFAGDLGARFPGGESGVEVVERHRTQFAEIADTHRGETVLVIVHQTAAAISLAELADNVSPAEARDRQLDNIESLELEGDASGWSLTRWPAAHRIH